MDHRLIQPASRDQIVAIIRQRAERANRDIPVHLGQAVFDRDIRAQLQAALPPEEELKPRLERLIQTENNFKYAGDKGSPGTFIAGIPLSPEKPYFELELVNAGNSGVPVCGPIIGLCSHKYPLDLLPGWSGESIGLNTADGKIYKESVYSLFNDK